MDRLFLLPSPTNIATIGTKNKGLTKDFSSSPASRDNRHIRWSAADRALMARYAALSSGLDIVRKALGGQQIAIAQTTNIDRPGGAINQTRF